MYYLYGIKREYLYIAVVVLSQTIVKLTNETAQQNVVQECDLYHVGKQGVIPEPVVLAYRVYEMITPHTIKVSNSYTMVCPPVRGDNPRALASGLSYVQVDKHSITILYHLH